jgi:hypothetical protein
MGVVTSCGVGVMAINEFLSKSAFAPDKQSKLPRPHEPTWLIWWLVLLLGPLFWAIIAVTFATHFQNNLMLDELTFLNWFLLRHVLPII